VRVRKARDVPARARKAHDEPLANGIGGDRKDDWDRAGKLLRLEPRSIDDQDIDPETEELCRQLREPLRVSRGMALLENEVLTFDIPQLTQSVSKRADPTLVHFNLGDR
jgi:hypothetical protein